jgi:hypothetical protein
MAPYSRASLVLMQNSGSLYQKNYSLVLNLNPRLQNNIYLRRNATNSNKNDVKNPEHVVKGIPYKNLTIGVPKEVFENERRVALTPGVAQNLAKKGFQVLIEENAGVSAKFNNDQYEQVGVKVTNAKNVFSQSDIILKVRPPSLNVNFWF